MPFVFRRQVIKDRQTHYLYVHVIFVAYCSGAASAPLTPRQVLGLLVNDTVFNAYLAVKYHSSGICPTCFSKPVICFQIHLKLGDVSPKPRLSDHNRCNYVRLSAPLQIPRTAEIHIESRNLIIRILWVPYLPLEMRISDLNSATDSPHLFSTC
jgi:hypothetical protein